MPTTISVSKIEGDLLDFWVHVALGNSERDRDRPYYSSDWNDGGPIIEAHRIELKAVKGAGWLASLGALSFPGDTALIAAMRCIVGRKFGDTVDLVEFR